jgi:hypothetical protein
VLTTWFDNPFSAAFFASSSGLHAETEGKRYGILRSHAYAAAQNHTALAETSRKEALLNSYGDRGSIEDLVAAQRKYEELAE